MDMFRYIVLARIFAHEPPPDTERPVIAAIKTPEGGHVLEACYIAGGAGWRVRGEYLIPGVETVVWWADYPSFPGGAEPIPDGIRDAGSA